MFNQSWELCNTSLAARPRSFVHTPHCEEGRNLLDKMSDQHIVNDKTSRSSWSISDTWEGFVVLYSQRSEDSACVSTTQMDLLLAHLFILNYRYSRYMLAALFLLLACFLKVCQHRWNWMSHATQRKLYYTNYTIITFATLIWIVITCVMRQRSPCILFNVLLAVPSCEIMSCLSLAGRLMMEFACGFVYVSPSVTQKDSQRSNANAIKRSGGISFKHSQAWYQRRNRNL